MTFNGDELSSGLLHTSVKRFESGRHSVQSSNVAAVRATTTVVPTSIGARWELQRCLVCHILRECAGGMLITAHESVAFSRRRIPVRGDRVGADLLRRCARHDGAGLGALRLDVNPSDREVSGASSIGTAPICTGHLDRGNSSASEWRWQGRTHLSAKRRRASERLAPTPCATQQSGRAAMPRVRAVRWRSAIPRRAARRPTRS